MRVSDYIFRTLADWGLRQAFLVTGGGAMHLNDALGREPRIQWLCNLHEQACAIAAEAYARTAGIPAVVCVTSGPGGTNAVTGVTGAWLDSIPMIVISGQIKTETMLSTYPELRLRQLGDQEINIVDIVRPITKYAAEVKDPQTIRYHLERACYLAMTGRPGPVWLDIPLDIQAAEISPDALSGYDAGEEPLPELNPADVIGTLSRLREAKRPVLIAGSGIISAGARELFRSIVRQWQIPVLTALSGIDLLPSDFPYFFGRPGILGARAANFILQNADLLLVIGTRMNIRQIGYDCKNVARAAYRIMVDIDSAELSKPTFRVDHKIHADAGDFLRALEGSGLPPKEDWLAHLPPPLEKAVPAGTPGTPQPHRLCQQLCLSGTAGTLHEPGKHHRHRKRNRIHKHISGASRPGRRPCNRQRRLCGNGLRSARGNRRCNRRAGPRCALHHRRRQHSDEFTGTSNDRQPETPGQNLPVQQRGVSFHQAHSEFILRRTLYRLNRRHRRRSARYAEDRGGLRFPYPAAANQ